jgi:hypothetical protein
MSEKIVIRKSPIADTRKCDFSRVTLEQLKASSEMHIKDVRNGLAFFGGQLQGAGILHDLDKLSNLSGFHADFLTGFKQTGWWDEHRKLNRHHLNAADGVRADVNLIDVMEFLVDCVMAGMARSGSVYELKLPDELLRNAFANTVKLLIENVEVKQ